MHDDDDAGGDRPVRTQPQSADALLLSLVDVLDDASNRARRCLTAVEQLAAQPPPDAHRQHVRGRLHELDAEVEAAEAADDIVALVQAVSAREAVLDDVRAVLGLHRPAGAGTATDADRVPSG